MKKNNNLITDYEPQRFKDIDVGNIDISIQEIAQDIEDSNLFTVTEEGYEEV